MNNIQQLALIEIIDDMDCHQLENCIGGCYFKLIPEFSEKLWQYIKNYMKRKKEKIGFESPYFPSPLYNYINLLSERAETPSHILSEISSQHLQMEASYILENIAGNPSTPKHYLKYILEKQTDYWILAYAYKNPSTSRKAKKKFRNRPHVNPSIWKY